MSSPDRGSGSSHPVFQTDLSHSPLPEILVTIHRHKAPGAIECRRGNELKEIFLDGGHIVFATSNQVRDSLGDRLLNEGRISREQYDESVRRLLSSGSRQGTILTEMRVLEAPAMLEAVREQIQDIVWSVFSWDGGRIAFTPGRDRHQEFVRLDIPIPTAILEGVRHMPDGKSLLARLGSRTTVVALTGHEVAELALDEDEENLLAQVDGKRSLGELVSTPPLSAGVNARLLYAFFALGLISVKPSGAVRVKLKTGGAGRPASR